jgi:uncharacterized protein YxjI
VFRGCKGLTQYYHCRDTDSKLLTTKVAIHLDEMNSTIEMLDRNGHELAVIKSILLSVRNSFHVKQQNIMIGKATQRFKLAKRKFNYTRMDNREELKLVGAFGASWKITKNHRAIATIKNLGPASYDIEIETHDNYDVLHVLALTFIMIQQRFCNKDDTKIVNSEQTYDRSWC